VYGHHTTGRGSHSIAVTFPATKFTRFPAARAVTSTLAAALTSAFLRSPNSAATSRISE
jgi:hypothetical protein